MKTEANVQFGSRLAALRKSRGLTQEQLAFLCHFDRTYIGYVERGEKSPTINTIVRLADGLNISLKEFFDYEAEE